MCSISHTGLVAGVPIDEFSKPPDGDLKAVHRKRAHCCRSGWIIAPIIGSTGNKLSSAAALVTIRTACHIQPHAAIHHNACASVAHWLRLRTARLILPYPVPIACLRRVPRAPLLTNLARSHAYPIDARPPYALFQALPLPIPVALLWLILSTPHLPRFAQPPARPIDARLSHALRQHLPCSIVPAVSRRVPLAPQHLRRALRRTLRRQVVVLIHPQHRRASPHHRHHPQPRRSPRPHRLSSQSASLHHLHSLPRPQHHPKTGPHWDQPPSPDAFKPSRAPARPPVYSRRARPRPDPR